MLFDAAMQFPDLVGSQDLLGHAESVSRRTIDVTEAPSPHNIFLGEKKGLGF